MLYNLREYHRPTDIDEAIRLLQRTDVKTVALAGGVSVIGEAHPDVEAVVDLSRLGLDFIEQSNGNLHIGAMVTLQAIVDRLPTQADGLLAETARRMAGWHVRNIATLGGTLASGNIHSPLSVALAALRARVRIYWHAGVVPFWADLSSQVRLGKLKGQLITAVTLSLPDRLGAAYEQVARTPADQPIVSAAAVAYYVPDGEVETVTAIGGLLQDLLVVQQTVALQQADQAVQEVAGQIVRERTPENMYQSNYLGSAEYRRNVAPVLARRALITALGRLGVNIEL